MPFSGLTTALYNEAYMFRQMLSAEEYGDCWTAPMKEILARSDAFARDNKDLLDKVLAAKPAARHRMLDKIPLNQRFYLIVSLARLAAKAAATLRAMDQWVHPEYTGPYGAMRYLPEVLNAHLEEEHYLWPFPFSEAWAS